MRAPVRCLVFAHQADEGAAAHVRQLLMAGRVPVVTRIAIKMGLHLSAAAVVNELIRSNITESAHGHEYSNGPTAMYRPE